MPAPFPFSKPPPAAVLALAAGLSLPLHPAAAAPVTATYRVFVGGVTALDVDAALEMTGGRYRITVSAVTGGTIGRLFSWRTEAESDGSAGDAGLRPSRHRQSSVLRGEPRRVELGYAAGGDVTASITPPPEEEGRPPVAPALRRGTIDPLTAVLDLLVGVERSEGCDHSFPVFDGRRRYDMVFSEVGRRIVDPSRYSAFSGVALQCRVTYRPIAGYGSSAPGWKFWQRDASADRPPVDLWLAAVAAGAPPLPVRLETDSDFGSVVMHLTGVTPPAAGLRAGAAPPPAR